MDGKSPRISANVGGHAGWAYQRYREITGKSPAVVLTHLIEYWTQNDSQASELGLTLADYRQENGAEVIPITAKQQEGRS